MTEPESPEAHEKILRRIRGLLDRAEHAETPAGESDACMAKAMQLMADYGIQRAMLAAAGRVDDPIDGTRFRINNPYSREKCGLLCTIAYALGCKVIEHHCTGRAIDSATVIGAASTRERIEVLYTSLLLQVTHGMLREPRSWTASETRRIRVSYFVGFSAAVRTRLREAEARATREYDAARSAHPGINGPGTALVLADRAALIDQRTAELFPDLIKPRKLRAGNYDKAALRNGAAAGAVADIGTMRVGNNTRSLEGAR